MKSEPRLARAGAGLPVIEWVYAKYIFLPRHFETAGKNQSLSHFQAESEKIIVLARTLPAELLGERRLVPRLRGLEDSSRYWSVSMTLEHLVTSGELIRRIVSELTSGSDDLEKIGIADLKPDPELDPAASIARFEMMSARFVEEMRAIDVQLQPQMTYPHPWFGQFDASQWLAFAAPHQAIHRRQIKEIIQRLG